MTGVLEEDGSLITDRDRIVDRAQEFCEKLYSSDRPDPEPRDLEMHYEWTGFPKVEPWEVKLAVKQ